MLLSSVPVALGLLFTASEALAMPVNNAGGMSETIAKRNDADQDIAPPVYIVFDYKKEDGETAAVEKRNDADQDIAPPVYIIFDYKTEEGESAPVEKREVQFNKRKDAEDAMAIIAILSQQASAYTNDVEAADPKEVLGGNGVSKRSVQFEKRKDAEDAMAIIAILSQQASAYTNDVEAADPKEVLGE